jgi:hypothetical protein
MLRFRVKKAILTGFWGWFALSRGRVLIDLNLLIETCQIQLGGKETFLKFESACTSEPEKCRAGFAGIYGMDLGQAVEAYPGDLRSGSFVPGDQTASIP